MNEISIVIADQCSQGRIRLRYIFWLQSWLQRRTLAGMHTLFTNCTGSADACLQLLQLQLIHVLVQKEQHVDVISAERSTMAIYEISSCAENALARHWRCWDAEIFLSEFWQEWKHTLYCFPPQKRVLFRVRLREIMHKLYVTHCFARFLIFTCARFYNIVQPIK